MIEIRTDSLQSLRELGPPDLVDLVKQPVKSTTKQVKLPERQAGGHGGDNRIDAGPRDIG